MSAFLYSSLEKSGGVIPLSHLAINFFGYISPFCIATYWDTRSSILKSSNGYSYSSDSFLDTVLPKGSQGSLLLSYLEKYKAPAPINGVHS